ncbi:MAG TPA: transglutaminase-like domain-containing protein [Candidatus Angelobacter sp.]|nr:transglutaminase-like domain-containing protein [Candidatus Angelobacter sp.]
MDENLRFIEEGRVHAAFLKRLSLHPKQGYNLIVAPAVPTVVQAFAELVRLEIDDERIDLLRAALAIARVEYPSLDSEVYVRRLQALAARVGAKIKEPGDPAQSIAALNEVLFEEEQFRGNLADYYNPQNSFLSDVLDRRLGIPITLALVYMEVARRVGFPLFGVGMPSHFMVKHYDIGGSPILIDVFEHGAIVSEQDCQRRLDAIYSGQLLLRPEFLAPVTRRQMLTRMLNNLKMIYLTQRNFRKALQVANLLLAIYPRSPEDVKQRAVLRYNLDDYSGALADFEDYLKMSPEAPDMEEILQTARSLRRSMARMN